MTSTDESSPYTYPTTARRRRLKTAVACATCRKRKVKCDGAPGSACNNCRKKESLQETCSYNHPTSTIPKPGRPLRSAAFQLPAVNNDRFDSQSEPLPLHQPAEKASPVPITIANEANIAVGEINAAVATRLGPPSADRPSLIATTDVPFFRVVLRDPSTGSNFHHGGNILPPQEEADRMVEIYWQYIHPLEPLVYKKTFLRTYHDLFSSNLHKTDQRIFLSTLNAIFALSTQVQASLQPEVRERTSETYFHRAWALLRPESIIWEPGTLDIIQCLLLISRYLQCTNDPHRTWMVLGLAIRMAQNLGLDIIEPIASHETDNSALRQHVWRCCVFMDRNFSWAYGRPSTASLSISTNSRIPDPDSSNLEGSSCYLIKTLELYEIANRIMRSRTPDCHTFADGLGLPPLREARDDFAIDLKLDQCLVKWENNLPENLRFSAFHDDTVSRAGNDMHRQSVVLRLRLFHSRIVLFRHILAQYCSSDHAEGSMLKSKNLSDCVLKDCAELCVENAQQIISLVQKVYMPGEAFGITTWWTRIFYLHLAGTILIAAMLRADLFTPSVTQSWDTAMLLLRAHAHLSPSIQQCVSIFLTLSSKIIEAQSPIIRQGPHNDGMGHMTSYFHDVFQDVGLDLDNSLFAMEDMAWLTNFER